MQRLLSVFLYACFCIPAFIICLAPVTGCTAPGTGNKPDHSGSAVTYNVPDTTHIPSDSNGLLVRYGRQLMNRTSYYIGPQGVNGQYTSTGVSCSNCHQLAGTKPFAFDLMTSFSRYPQYRAREDRVLSLADRVNNCITRPLNGKPLPENSTEMKAFLFYLKWLDSSTSTDHKKDWGKSLPVTFINRAADTIRGAGIYQARCARCHGTGGEGKLNEDSQSYLYPVLWGNKAYQSGSSIYRVIKMSGWLKANMPYDSARYDKPVLTDEEAIDVAAYINSRPRPQPVTFDYPKPDKKPIDHDRGPYADTFSTVQHKYGPFQPIIDYWKSKGLKASY